MTFRIFPGFCQKVLIVFSPKTAETEWVMVLEQYIFPDICALIGILLFKGIFYKERDETGES